MNTAATQRQPRSGDAYAGVYSVIGNGREYIQQRLASPLQAGTYYAEFFVSLAPASRRTARSLGMAITATPPTVPTAGGQVLSTLTPQITNGSTALPAGTNPGWTRISGTFTATGGEEYITLGNFLADVANGVNTLPQNGPGIPSGSTSVAAAGAYYFIEDVSIVPVKTEAYTETIACNQSQVLIGKSCFDLPPGYTFNWSPTTNMAQPSSLFTAVSPTVPTTYTLTVSSGSQVVQTYTWNVQPARYGYATLGAAGTVTTLNAFGATLLYNGNYRVLGELVLTNGAFELAPGTHFWMDSPLSSSNEPTGRITVGANATLRLDNATVESFCTNAWQGIKLDVLAPNARLIVENSSTIADAKYGVLAENPNTYWQVPTYDTHYSITNSTFRNNLNHVVDDSRHADLTTSSVISGSTFTSAALQMLAPYYGLHTYEALHVEPFSTSSPDGSVTIAGNSIDQAIYGIVSTKTNQSRVHITNNLMQNIYTTGIWLQDGYSEALSSNHIYLNPENLFNSPQFAYDSPVTGIDCGSSSYGASVSSFNYVYGPALGSVFDPRPQTGIVAGENQQVEKSWLFNLDVGLRTQNGQPTLAGNRTINCAEGVRISPSIFGNTNAVVRCNSFSRTSGNSLYSFGIVIANGGNQISSLGSNSQPAGNQFSNIQETLRNDDPNPVTYWRYNSSQENVSWSGIGGFVQTNTALSPVNACRNQPTPYTAGVNAARGTDGGLAFIQALMDSVARRNAPTDRLRDYQGQIVRYFAQRNDLAPLELFLGRLETVNPVAHRSVGLSMLRLHRQQGNVLRAQWVRGELLRTAGQDAEVHNQVKLSDVLANLARRPVRPGQRLLAADSVALRQVALSGTDGAEDAATWLRYYYPQALPGTAYVPLRPYIGVTKPAEATASTRLDGASPNPANTELTVHYELNAGVQRAEVQLYSLLTGKRVLSQALPVKAGTGRQVLDLRGLVPGQYSYRLVTNGQSGPAKHLIIAR